MIRLEGLLQSREQGDYPSYKRQKKNYVLTYGAPDCIRPFQIKIRAFVTHKQRTICFLLCQGNDY